MGYMGYFLIQERIKLNSSYYGSEKNDPYDQYSVEHLGFDSALLSANRGSQATTKAKAGAPVD
jgi:hypothetical protein